jgi:hypothetical protein
LRPRGTLALQGGEEVRANFDPYSVAWTGEAKLHSIISLVISLLAGIALIASLSVPASAVIAFSVAPSEDGFIIAGSVGEYLVNSKAFLLKIDSEGREIWNRTYARDCASAFWTVSRVYGGYAVGGLSGCDETDAWIAKVDEEGRILWEKVYGKKEGNDSVLAFAPDYGGFFAAITTSCDRCFQKDTLIVRLDNDGNEVWRRVFNSMSYNSIKMIKRTGDGGLVAVGTVSRFDNSYPEVLKCDVWIMKLNAAGGVVWNRFLNLSPNLEWAWDVAESPEGYTVVGAVWGCKESCTTDGQRKSSIAFILKLNRNGDLVAENYVEWGHACSAWSVLGDGTVAGLFANETGKYVWIVRGNETISVLQKDLLILPNIGIVRMLETRDGYLLVSTACDGKCVWAGKFDLAGKLVWERTYGFPEDREREDFEVREVGSAEDGSNTAGSPAEVADSALGAGNNSFGNSKILFYALLLLIFAILIVVFSLRH